MNFREELNKIKEEKQTVKSGYEKAITNILNQILAYFREKDENELSDATEIFFGKDAHNRVYGRVYICDQLDRTANFVVSTESKEEALLVLTLLEQKYKDEKFVLLPGISVSRDGCFSVIIKV